jgi:hypothetical protein
MVNPSMQAFRILVTPHFTLQHLQQFAMFV